MADGARLEPLSPRHPHVVEARSLLTKRAQRRSTGRFVLEGRRFVLDALAGNAPTPGRPQVVRVLLDAEASPDPELEALAATAGVELNVTRPGVIGRIASTTTPQPVLAVAAIHEARLEAALAPGHAPAVILVLVGIGDPGNVGTAVRSAAAAGVGAVALTPDCADVWGPKAVRASAGTVLRIPIVPVDSVAGVCAALRDAGGRCLATVVAGGGAPEDVDLTSTPVAVLVGGETHGIPQEAIDGCDALLSIPMAPGVDSLNAAMAATLVVFEIARQRRVTGTDWTSAHAGGQGVRP